MASAAQCAHHRAHRASCASCGTHRAERQAGIMAGGRRAASEMKSRAIKKYQQHGGMA